MQAIYKDRKQTRWVFFLKRLIEGDNAVPYHHRVVRSEKKLKATYDMLNRRYNNPDQPLRYRWEVLLAKQEITTTILDVSKLFKEQADA